MTKEELYESLIDRILNENKKLREYLFRAEPFIVIGTCTFNGIAISASYQKRGDKLLDELHPVLYIAEEDRKIYISPIAKEFQSIKQNNELP